MITSSIVRTNKLRCSECEIKLKKDELAYFELDDEDKIFENVYCESCASELSIDLDDMAEEPHIFSGEAIGQY